MDQVSSNICYANVIAAATPMVFALLLSYYWQRKFREVQSVRARKAASHGDDRIVAEVQISAINTQLVALNIGECLLAAASVVMVITYLAH